MYLARKASSGSPRTFIQRYAFCIRQIKVSLRPTMVDTVPGRIRARARIISRSYPEESRFVTRNNDAIKLSRETRSFERRLEAVGLSARLPLFLLETRSWVNAGTHLRVIRHISFACMSASRETGEMYHLEEE